MYKYQNVSNVTQTLVQSGNITPRSVEPDAYVLSDVAIENPNFKFIGSESDASVVGVENRELATTEAEFIENNNQETGEI